MNQTFCGSCVHSGTRRHADTATTCDRWSANWRSASRRRAARWSGCPPADLPRKKVSLEYITEAVGKRKAWEDLHWTLLNTKEFLFRH